MAEQDSFIQEVTEEVRRDRMFSVWKKYGPILIALIVLAVLGAAAKGWWENRVAAQKQSLGGRMIAADAIEDSGASAEAFSTLAEDAEYGIPALARLRAGAAFAQAGEPDRARAEYERILESPDADARLRALAELRLVMLDADTAPPDALLSRLSLLVAPDSPWRMQALEFSAGLKLRNSDVEAARADLQRILDDPAVLPGTRERVLELLAALPSPDGAAPDAGDREEPAAEEPQAAPQDTATDDASEGTAEQEEETQ